MLLASEVTIRVSYQQRCKVWGRSCAVRNYSWSLCECHVAGQSYRCFEGTCCVHSYQTAIPVWQATRRHISESVNLLTAVQPRYNDIGLYDTSPIQSYFLWYELIRHC
jgi:hypothetical protein